jgi:hypothetical protein
MRKKTLSPLLIVFEIVLLYPLITGSEVLLVPVLNEPYLPLGTLSTCMAMILPALIILIGTKPSGSYHFVWAGRTIRILLWVSLIMAVLWPFISYVLSGNLTFTFSNSMDNHELRLKTFWYYSAIPPTLSATALLFLAFNSVLKTMIRSSDN